jgi:hypothetical protein
LKEERREEREFYMRGAILIDAEEFSVKKASI